MDLSRMTVDWSHVFESCTSITAGSGFSVEGPGEVVFRTGSAVILEDGFSVGPGASFTVQIYPDVCLNPGISVTKTADPTTASGGDTITYSISVENDGEVPLTETAVTDAKCDSAPAYQSGDDGDSELDVGETWVYECTGTAEATTYTNIATATFEDAIGQEVTDTGEAEVTVEVSGCTGGSPSLPRYVDLSNGTVYDCWMGLLWLKDASCGDLAGTGGLGRSTWSTAKAAAAALAHGTCGLTDGSTAGDWRLPTMYEFCGAWSGGFGSGSGFCDETQGLINDNFSPVVSNTAGDGAWSEGDPFTGINTAWYHWSSTEYDGTNAWITNFTSVTVTIGSKTDEYTYVWPVR
jgi:hypothetical protein